MVLFVEKQNEPDSEDYKFRKLFLTASMTQKKPITYQLNSKVAKIDDLQNFIISRPKSNVRFDEKKRILNFSDLSGTPLSKDELQDIYTSLFEQYDDQQALVFMSARKIVNTNATTKKGAFMKNGALYSYDWSNSDVIKVTDSKGNVLSKKELELLDVGFVPTYWDGTTALGDLLKDPKVLAHFEKGTAVVYHPKGYTRELNKAKKLNTEKQLLYISYGSEELQINLNPQEWVHTNPSLTEFKKYSM